MAHLLYRIYAMWVIHIIGESHTYYKYCVCTYIRHFHVPLYHGQVPGTKNIMVEDLSIFG